MSGWQCRIILFYCVVLCLARPLTCDSISVVLCCLITPSCDLPSAATLAFASGRGRHPDPQHPLQSSHLYSPAPLLHQQEERHRQGDSHRHRSCPRPTAEAGRVVDAGEGIEVGVQAQGRPRAHDQPAGRPLRPRTGDSARCYM